MKTSKIDVYGISNCDTIKKARKWLTDNEVEYEFHDFKKVGLEEGTLRAWVDVVGWEVLLNRRGTTWRKVPQPTKDGVNESVAIDLMLATPAMIKRPVLIRGNHIEVGFKAEQYAVILNK